MWSPFGLALVIWLSLVTGRVSLRYLLPDPHPPWERLLPTAVLVCSIWLVLVPVIWWILRAARWGHRGAPSQVVLALLVAILAAICEVSWGAVILRPELLETPRSLFAWMLARFDLSLVTAYAVLAAIIVTGSRATSMRLQQQRERMEGAKRSGELGDLAARLHPHFLFNTLNTVMDRLTADPIRAGVVAGAIADLIERSADPRRGDLHSLGEELDLLAAYVAIQRERFGDRLDFQVDIPDGMREQVQVPAMALQPLVENALAHGLQLGRRRGQVVVSARRRLMGVELRVTSPAPAHQIESGSGIGLSVTRRRLEVLYRGRASCRLRVHGKFATAVIRLPRRPPQMTTGEILHREASALSMAVPRRPFIVGVALLAVAVVIGTLGVLAQAALLADSVVPPAPDELFVYTAARAAVATLVAVAAVAMARTIPIYQLPMSTVVPGLLVLALFATAISSAFFSPSLARLQPDLSLVLATITAAGMLTGYARRIVVAPPSLDEVRVDPPDEVIRETPRLDLHELVEGLRSVGDLASRDRDRAERVLHAIVRLLRCNLVVPPDGQRSIEVELHSARACWDVRGARYPREVTLQSAVAPGVHGARVVAGALVRALRHVSIPDGDWHSATLVCYGSLRGVRGELHLAGPHAAIELPLGTMTEAGVR